MFNIGDRIGDFTIVSRLKAGGMATLYLGQRSGAAGFAKHVAIKVVHPHLSDDPTFVRMFVDEALLSARIQHPNVVHVEELGEAEGTYFLVMEFVHGVSLSALIRALARRKRKIAPELAVAIAIQVADGLHAAHETRGPSGEPLGVVHRDVSPQNVLLSYTGHVKLIDFGIAKAEGRTQSTAAGSIKGKFRYMSPEQALGRPVDRRSDVYALGIVLWEMLAGKSCFDGANDLLVLDKVRNPQIDPPSTYAPHVPPALDTAVMHALHPSVEKRPATAKELRRKLGEAFPMALSMDATQLSELLLTVMTDQIDQERRDLPSNVMMSLDRSLAALGIQGDAAGKGDKDGEELLLTVTLDADDILTEAEGSEREAHDISPAAVARSVTVHRAGAAPRRPAWLPWVVAGAVLLGGGLAAVALGGGGDETGERAPAAPPVAPPVVAQPAATADAGPAPAPSDAGATAVAQVTVPDASTGAAAQTKRTKRTKRGGTRPGGGPLLVDDVF